MKILSSKPVWSAQHNCYQCNSLLEVEMADIVAKETGAREIRTYPYGPANVVAVSPPTSCEYSFICPECNVSNVVIAEGCNDMRIPLDVCNDARVRAGLKPLNEDNSTLTFYCDNKRHLICVPYSVENLHRMAEILGIKRCWFHNSPGHQHYDIPKRRIAEIQAKCKVITDRELLALIKGVR